MAATKATWDILKGAVYDRDLSTSTFRIYRKSGGFQQARKDFGFLKPFNVGLTNVYIVNDLYGAEHTFKHLPVKIN